VLLVLALACGFEDMVSGFVVQTGFATLPALPCLTFFLTAQIRLGWTPTRLRPGKWMEKVSTGNCLPRWMLSPTIYPSCEFPALKKKKKNQTSEHAWAPERDSNLTKIL
jgi:hypothetical protein